MCGINVFTMQINYMITRGDLIVVKCHLRNWRNINAKQHGLLVVGLLKKEGLYNLYLISSWTLFL
jgi:hypothetical protein